MSALVEADVGALHHRGATAWPMLRLSRESFERHLARHVAESSPDALHVADFFLAAACVEGVVGAPAALQREFLSRVPTYVARVMCDAPVVVDDFVQSVRHKLLVAEGERLPRIAEYSGRGPLAGWLRVLSVRMALSVVRRRDRQSIAASVHDVAIDDEPENRQLGARYREPFKEALEAAFGMLDGDQRLLLRLHASGASGEEIARLLGVDRSTATRRLARARQLLFEATREAMTRKLRLSASEFRSIARIAEREIDLTLSRVLRTA